MILGWDVETHLLKPGLVAPRLVCLSASDGTLLARKDAVPWFKSKLQAGVILAAHNLVFDAGVMVAEDPSLLDPVFDALEEGRLVDTLTREQLADTARGGLLKRGYGLDAIAFRRWGLHVEKANTWRLRFGELDGIPVEEWPEDARAYALLDAELAARLFAEHPETLSDEERQTCAAFWLHLSSGWGLRTDPTAVSALKRRLERRIQKLERFYLGSAYVRANGTKDVKAIRAKILETIPDVPRTPTGLPETSAEILEATGMVPLRALAKVARAQKLLSTYVPVLEEGTRYPITPSYGFAETGRTTSYNPNIQNVPTFPGIRECYVPREGFVYVDLDYKTLELRALAQSCLERFGFSRMADALRAGRDLHTAFAASLLERSYEDACTLVETTEEGKYARKLAKAFNFGVPGGLGATTFIEFARSMYGVTLTPWQFKRFKAQYLNTFPEIRLHLDHAGQLTAAGPATIGPPLLRIQRGGLGYCALANILFQERAAAGAKDAGWLITRACYRDTGPVSGSRIVAFVHDQYVLETPRVKVIHAVPEIERLAIEGMRRVIPDVPIEVSTKVTERWEK